MLGINRKGIEDKCRVLMPMYRSIVDPHLAYFLPLPFQKVQKRTARMITGIETFPLKRN